MMQRKLPRYPIGIQTFEKLRKEGFAYVDKTGYIPMLLDNSYYFLSRPRRFGKSLFLSTLEAYFRGQKELFEGLAIYEWEKEWRQYPVVHIDFNTCNGADADAFVKDLHDLLCRIATRYHIPEEYGDKWTPKEYSISSLFTEIIERLHDMYSMPVVVLIDEYDKGILEVHHEQHLLDRATAILRPFFNVLKSSDRYIRFAFITGVSRFRNTTLFSGFNSPIDISMNPRYASLLGISHEEMMDSFEPSIHLLAEEEGWDMGTTLQVLRDKYDGYRFTKIKEYLYNPFSLMNALNDLQLDNYWVQTGSSRILATHLRESHFTLEELTSKWVSKESLQSTYTSENPLSLFFQTGYLTIRECSGNFYRLGIPNQEVQSALVDLVIPEFVKKSSENEISDERRQLEEAIMTGDVDMMMHTLKVMLSGIPYHEIDTKTLEKHIHLCMYVIFLMLGVNTKCEVASAAGRVDMVAQTPWKVYVFEFKLDRSPEEALSQIDDRGYAIQYEAGHREVYKIGVEFSTKTRTIASWKVIK